MQYVISDKWVDYELLDAGDGEKLERWGEVILRRPDPQVIWPAQKNSAFWEKVDAVYHRSEKGGGSWEFKKEIVSGHASKKSICEVKWIIEYGDLKFYIKAMSFKHTGLFPEQGENWDWMRAKIKAAKRPVSVLNLFGYTGGATVACAKEGASVCHVDASKGMVYHASENMELNGLKDAPVRWIVDDVVKFVEREIKRGKTYDAILMDPPSYGKGPKGETWKAEEDLYMLIEKCAKLLSKTPVFFLINSYTTGFSPMVLKNIMELTVNSRLYNGRAHGASAQAGEKELRNQERLREAEPYNIQFGEVGLPISDSKLVLPCGVFARYARA